jgi:hypothetical protein
MIKWLNPHVLYGYAYADDLSCTHEIAPATVDSSFETEKLSPGGDDGVPTFLQTTINRKGMIIIIRIATACEMRMQESLVQMRAMRSTVWGSATT